MHSEHVTGHLGEQHEMCGGQSGFMFHRPGFGAVQGAEDAEKVVFLQLLVVMSHSGDGWCGKRFCVVEAGDGCLLWPLTLKKGMSTMNKSRTLLSTRVYKRLTIDHNGMLLVRFVKHVFRVCNHQLLHFGKY